MTGIGRPVIVPPGGGTEFRIAGDRFRRKGEARERTAAFSVIEYEGAPGGIGPPLHVHRSFEEAWFLLDGEVEFTAAGTVTRATAGTYLLLPRGVPHSFRVAGRKPARWLGVFSPGRYVGLVEEIGALIPAVGPPDARAMRRLFAKWGSEIVVPGGGPSATGGPIARTSAAKGPRRSRR